MCFNTSDFYDILDTSCLIDMLPHVQPLVKTEGATHVLPRKEGNGLELLTLLILLLVLALAAGRWGFDSRDGPLSPEWERRRWHDVNRQRRNERRDEL
jgi:hypothetical protein